MSPGSAKHLGSRYSPLARVPPRGKTNSTRKRKKFTLKLKELQSFVTGEPPWRGPGTHPWSNHPALTSLPQPLRSSGARLKEGHCTYPYPKCANKKIAPGNSRAKENDQLLSLTWTLSSKDARHPCASANAPGPEFLFANQYEIVAKQGHFKKDCARKHKRSNPSEIEELKTSKGYHPRSLSSQGIPRACHRLSSSLGTGAPPRKFYQNIRLRAKNGG